MTVADAGRAFDMVWGGEIGGVAIKFFLGGRPCQHGWARSQVRVVPQTGNMLLATARRGTVSSYRPAQ